MKACALKFVKLYIVKCGRASALEKKGRLSEAYHYPFSPKHDIPKRFKCKCVIKPTRFRLPRYLHVNIVPILVSIATRCFYMFFRVTMKTLNVYEQWNFSLFSLINNEYRRERYDGTQKFTCVSKCHIYFLRFLKVLLKRFHDCVSVVGNSAIKIYIVILTSFPCTSLWLVYN